MRVKRLLRTLMSLVALVGLARGQGLALELRPDRTLSGPGGTFSVEVTLQNPHESPVAAYQLYLGYDADLLSAEGVAWPDGAVLAAEGRFATGRYDGRVAKLFPEWRDGLGTDVVSVSGFRGAAEPPGRGGVVCVITFRVLAATRTTTAFALDPGPYWSFSGVFDDEGMSIPAELSIVQVRLSPVGPLRNVLCTRADNNVTVSWDRPQDPVDAIEVRRDGVLVKRLEATATSLLDRSVVPGVHIYEVAAVRGSDTGPRESCTARLLIEGPGDLNCHYDGQAVKLTWTLPFQYGYIDLIRNDEFVAQLDGAATAYDDVVSAQSPVTLTYALRGVLAGLPSETPTCVVNLSTQQGVFLRGDTNLDGRHTLPDAVFLLRYLFGGGQLPCLDAADFDDNGRLQIGDAVGLLAWLFSGGAPPAPPTQAPDADPTPDGLSCVQGLEE